MSVSLSSFGTIKSVYRLSQLYTVEICVTGYIFVYSQTNLTCKKTIHVLGSKCVSYFYICSLKRKKSFLY
ncbi:protein of unknown function [Paenibacillus alvei]|uniref:Uncharacterized protein n=1 Tax=Paenibacillus alvei TaxID=44250 RepID=A0A383RAQ2_PAEAL|nr:protein of unknown function [Paenibacillus alvei]